MPTKRVAARREEGTGLYRRLLLEKRSQVLSSLGVRFDTLAVMGRVSEEDQGQIYHDEYISLSLNSIDYEQLRLVEEALDRLRVGDYGVCLACEEPIPPKRLRAVPWARYCVSCQEEAAAMATLPREGPAEPAAVV